jgi:uncharacterized damage-inducible protein DinB
MKEILLDYAGFNAWAQEQILKFVCELTPEQQHQEVVSSFSGLYKTLLHVWVAENAWFKRLGGESPLPISYDPFSGSTKDLSQALEALDQQLVTWIGNQNAAALGEILNYVNFKGEKQERAIYRVVMHAINHATYHRGQVVTILRQLGVENIPATDFNIWAGKTR